MGILTPAWGLSHGRIVPEHSSDSLNKASLTIFQLSERGFLRATDTSHLENAFIYIISACVCM